MSELVDGETVLFATAAAIADVPELRTRLLGDLLPGLAELNGDLPAPNVKDVRAWVLVKRQTADSWNRLAAISVDEIASWPGAGAAVVREVVSGALAAWVGERRAASAAEDVPVEGQPHDWEVALAPLRMFVAAAYRSGATTVAEAFEVVADGGVPASTWDQLATVRLDRLLDLQGRTEAAWRAVLNFDGRERRVLLARVVSSREKPTLAELGEELGVSRERVRQIENRVRRMLNERLDRSDDCAPVAHLAALARRQLGTIVSDKHMVASLRALVGGHAPDPELRWGVLRARAGAYELVDGVWQRDAALDRLRKRLLERRSIPLTDEELDELLTTAGVVTDERPAVCALLPLRRFDDRNLVWTGGLPDKACLVLQVHGEPMSREALHDAMGAEEVNFRSLINAIQADPRIRRLGRDRYGLADWGGEEYTTISDEIAQAIERRGGRATLDELVEELVELFGVAEQSVRSYAASRRFRRCEDGTLIIAPDGAAPAPATPMPPELDRDLVRHDGIWHMRLAVDRDSLRGSGRPVRTAIALAAGVRPGESRTLALDGGVVPISWRGHQPALGSTRALIERLRCVEGDWLFIPMGDGGKAFARTRGELEAVTGTDHVACRLGLRPGVTIAEIASALGFDSDASHADVRARLRARGDEELAALVQPSPVSDDAILAQLTGLGD